MAYTRQQYSADHFSGANVTVSMGPTILTQAFGVQWSLQQLKMPIYGYNSQYFDAFAKGQVGVEGALYINFVSPRYLSVTIHRFWQTVGLFNGILQVAGSNSAMAENFGGVLRADPNILNLISAVAQYVDMPENLINILSGEFSFINDERYAYRTPIEGVEDDRGWVDSRPATIWGPTNSNATFNQILEDVMNDDNSVNTLTRMIWGGGADMTGTTMAPFSGTDSRRNPDLMLRQWSAMYLAAQEGNPVNMTSSYGRPDQFGHPVDGANGIDIVVSYGNPFDDQITDTTYQYDHSCSEIIKGVHFKGQSRELMADGRPVLDVYQFFARSVHPYPTYKQSRGV